MIYLNNAATTKTKPPEVPEAVISFMRDLNVSPGRGTDASSVAADNILSETRGLLARLFNADEPNDIVFTLNCSDALNTALKGSLNSGDHVLISPIEHNSVIRPLRYLEKLGIEVSVIDAHDRNGTIRPEKLSGHLRKNTKMIACLHASNVTGTIQPLKDIGRFAKDNGVLFLVDAAQTAGSYDIDVKEMNIDLLAFAGHKGLMGPMGTGGLYISRKLSTLSIPLRHGGTGSLSEMETQPELMPDKFETGTPNTPGIAGLKAAVEFILKTGVSKIQKHGETLTEMTLEGLRKISGVRLYGPDDRNKQAPVISFNIQGMEPGSVGEKLEKEFGIIVRTGLHCAPLCHKLIGTFPKGTVRISTGYFNTEDDIDAAVNAVREIARKN